MRNRRARREETGGIARERCGGEMEKKVMEREGRIES